MSGRANRAASHRLVVLGGVREDVEVTLPDGSSTLGADLERDIVLSDPALDAHQLTVVVDGDVVTLEIAAAGVSRDGEELEPGSRHRADPGTAYAVGALRFAIVPDGHLPGDGGRAEEGPARAPTLGEGTRDESFPYRPDEEEAATRSDESRRLFARLLGGGFALVALLVGGSYVWHSLDGGGSEPLVERAPPAMPLAARLSAAGFEGLDTRRGADGALAIEGYVASRARLLELQRFAALIDPAPRVDVFVQSEIAERVGDVYRTHGIDATVEPLESGMVRVSTTERETPDFLALQQAAREDVPGLRAVQARNEAPPLPPDEKAPAASVPHETPPGKRVVAVIEGDPSYVVTEDDARYFVGSSLPTGHTIAVIEDRSVTLDRDGERTRLDF